MARMKTGEAGHEKAVIKWRETMEAKYGEDWRKRLAEIGAKGGRKGHTGGFASDPELARTAGAKGGRTSKRGPIRKGYYEITDLTTGEVLGSVYTTSHRKALIEARSTLWHKIKYDTVLEANIKKTITEEETKN